MSRTISIILVIVAIALIAYNITFVNFSNLLEKESAIALIGIMASLCAIVLLWIFITSKKIQKKMNEN